MMDRITEWIFTGDVHPFQVIGLIVAVYLGKAFLESCYGRFGGPR